jgi:oligopeptidase A
MDDVAGEASAAPGNGHRPDFPADWTPLPSAGRRHRAPGPRLGRRQPPEQRGRHARVARRLQRRLPRVTEFWTRLGADERLYAKYKAIDPAQLNPSSARPTAKRHAQLRAVGGAELQGRQGALRRHPGAQAELARNSAKTRSTPPTPSAYYATPKNWMACPADVQQPPAPPGR